MNRAAVAPLAAAARRAMSCHVAIARQDPDADPVWDDDEQAYVDPPPIEVYTGPGLIRPAPADARVVTHGDGTAVLRRYDVWMPPEVTVELDDTVTATDTGDDQIEGAGLHVLDVPGDPWRPVRKVVVEHRM